jgi:F-type H+-transporting ATPase subunit delta
MTQENLIKNYAAALFNNAQDSKIANDILKQVTAMSQAIDGNIGGRKTLLSPIIHKSDKVQIINSLIKILEINQVVQNFLLLLVKNSRMSILPAIIKAYNELLYESQNRKIVQVISAKTLEEKEQEWVKHRVETELKQKAEIAYKVDKAIIGGIIIKYDSMLQDYSIKGAITKISRILKTTILK